EIGGSRARMILRLRCVGARAVPRQTWAVTVPRFLCWKEAATVNRTRSLQAGLFVVLSGAVLAAAATSGRASDGEPLSIRKGGTDEKKFMENLGKAVIKAAHPTSKEPTVKEAKKTNPKEGRTSYHIKMEYSGVVSGLVSKKKYTADIEVKIDSSDKDKWEVEN